MHYHYCYTIVLSIHYYYITSCLLCNYLYCQNEILAKIRADLIRKYGEGNLPTDPNKLYDLESDTSGSDSSSDEGLPAHIEHIQQSQVTLR